MPSIYKYQGYIMIYTMIYQWYLSIPVLMLRDFCWEGEQKRSFWFKTHAKIISKWLSRNGIPDLVLEDVGLEYRYIYIYRKLCTVHIYIYIDIYIYIYIESYVLYMYSYMYIHNYIYNTEYVHIFAIYINHHTSSHIIIFFIYHDTKTLHYIDMIWYVLRPGPPDFNHPVVWFLSPWEQWLGFLEIFPENLGPRDVGNPENSMVDTLPWTNGCHGNIWFGTKLRYFFNVFFFMNGIGWLLQRLMFDHFLDMT